jgi:hypothetical protein
MHSVSWTRWQRLNSADIAKTLQSEHTAAMAAVKPEVQAVLTEAFRLGDKAEGSKPSSLRTRLLRALPESPKR